MKYLNWLFAVTIIISLLLSLTELSWWWILSPIWIPLAYIFVVANITFVAVIVTIMVNAGLDEYYSQLEKEVKECLSKNDSN